VRDIERYEKRKTPMHLYVKNEKGKDTGELNVEIEWGLKEVEEKKTEPLEEKKVKEKEEEPRKKAEKPQERSLKETIIEPEKISKPVSEEDTLKVRIINAKFYEKQDVIEKGDPYVTINFNNKKQRTKTYKNTKTPTYNEGINIHI
jgi:negative regulator of genetic competence, sporulation and motility